jgi:8-oxo-dGTP diphosphatase
LTSTPALGELRRPGSVFCGRYGAVFIEEGRRVKGRRSVRQPARQERFRLVSAVHVFLLRDRRVLLLRRYNTGYEDGKYSVIAGHLNGGEKVTQAAVREALEEVGLQLDPSSLDVVGVMHRQSDDERIDFFLTCRRWKGDIQNLEPDKCDRLEWFALDGLPETVIAYVRRALQNFQEGRWFDSYGWPVTPTAGAGSQASGETTT